MSRGCVSALSCPGQWERFGDLEIARLGTLGKSGGVDRGFRWRGQLFGLLDDGDNVVDPIGGERWLAWYFDRARFRPADRN
jgi:hypothetical protein